jgi:hypothetical protein
MSLRETMKQSAAQEAERTSARIEGQEQEQLRLWLEDRTAEIEQNCRKMLRAEIESATKRLEVGVTSSLSSLADKLRSDNLGETAAQLVEPVIKMSELIATLERVSQRADEKLGDLQFRGGQMLKLIQIQEQQVLTFEALVKRGEITSKNLHAATRAGIDTLLNIWVRRWKGILLSLSAIILLTIFLGTRLHAWAYQPTWLTIEESNYWRLLTYDMKEEEKARLIQRLKAKQPR